MHCIPKAGRGLLLEKREAKDSLSLSLSSPPLFSRLRSVRRPPLKSSFALDSVGQGTKNVALAPGHHAPPPPRGEGGIERSMCVRRKAKGRKRGRVFPPPPPSGGSLITGGCTVVVVVVVAGMLVCIYSDGHDRERERGRCLLLRCVLYKRSGGDANEDEEAEADLKGGEGLWDFLRLRLSFMPLPY